MGEFSDTISITIRHICCAAKNNEMAGKREYSLYSLILYSQIVLSNCTLLARIGTDSVAYKSI